MSADGKYLAVSSNFSDGTVTEHSIFVFELQAAKDPLFVHKVTFMTDFAQDYLRQLNFEIQSKGEAILSGCTVNSCMLITFALRNKKLEQYQKEFSLNDDPDSKRMSLSLATFSCLASLGNTVWACSTENKINRIAFR